MGNGALPDSAIEEILRWSAPTIHTVRLALQDLEICGQTIRAGDPVALVLGSGNFDPSKFEAPEAFNVMRSPNEHIAFGTAAHTCLGLHVARLELKVMFEQLLSRCTTIELDGDVEFVRDNLIHGIRKMPLALS
jgi:cytochrome P450